MKGDTPTVAARRRRLQEWLDARYQGRQAEFVRTAQVNQGELSALLKDKSFGEKRAASLEAKAGMPAGYLVTPLEPSRVAARVAEPAASDSDRLRQMDDAINALTYTLAATLRTIAAQAPELGRSLEVTLGALVGASGSEKQVTEAATRAVELGLQSWESAGRRASPAVSAGKQSRKGR